MSQTADEIFDDAVAAQEQPPAPEVEPVAMKVTKTTLTPIKTGGVRATNKAALDALASVAGGSATAEVWVERLAPATYGGRRLKGGKLSRVRLTVSDLKDTSTLYSKLGRIGTEFRVGIGADSRIVSIGDGSLAGLDEFDFEDAPTPPSVPYMQPTMVPTPGAPTPWGWAPPPIRETDIAKAVADAVKPFAEKGKEDAEMRRFVMELEEKRLAREEKLREAKEAEERRREERERDRQEKREKEEKEDRLRREKEERERQEKREKEEREARQAQAAREQADRERREKEERDRREDERRRDEDRRKQSDQQFQLMLEQMRTAATQQQQFLERISTERTKSDEGFFEKMLKFQQLQPKPNPMRDMKELADFMRVLQPSPDGAGRNAFDSLIENLPDVITAFGALRAAQPTATVTQQPTQAASLPAPQPAPEVPMFKPELADALTTVTDAITNGRSAKECYDVMKASGKMNSVLAQFGKQSATELFAEFQRYSVMPTFAAEHKTILANLSAAVTKAPNGIVWLTTFLEECKKGAAS